MRTALVIPSIGASHLGTCLEAVAALDPAPDLTVLVLSGGTAAPAVSPACEVLQCDQRLGFAVAVDTGLSSLPAGFDAVAILNDDALPAPEWLGKLVDALAGDPELASVQGTVVDAEGAIVDGRGIAFDPFGLPVQIDRGLVAKNDHGQRPVLAVSATAGLYRTEALRRVALASGQIFDHEFDCYHEDLDLGLRLNRQGWRSRWIGDAPTKHLGSASSPSFRWRHPWWLLANRWRALAGNLSPAALLKNLPRLLRGEIRAVHTLIRSNPRAPLVAATVLFALPLLVSAGWKRETPGSRLDAIPEVAP